MNKKSFERYFQNELGRIRGLAKEFSSRHPAVAPLLNDNNADPDAQRLLEGVAFLTALLNQKLDDEFPEVIHGLMNILFPHYIRPVPALSIVEFSPKPSLKETISIPKGTIINSVPIDDVECSFATTMEFDIYPVVLENLFYDIPKESESSLSLDIRVLDGDLSTFDLEGLDFYLSESYDEASNLFMLLMGYLKNITIECEESKLSLPPEALECQGFNRDNSLFNYPQNAFWSYMILQEYFLLPQKLLFFRLKNLQILKKYANIAAFKIVFHFEKPPLVLDSLSKESIKLFCTPVNNLFDEEAEPITVTHEKEFLQVHPPMRYKDAYRVYDVNKVSGYIQGETEQKQYFPFESFEKSYESNTVYQIHRKVSILDNQEELFLSLHYDEMPQIEKETLSVKISCTNGRLPERLKLGEISQSSDNSPELTTFKNIITCTMPIDAPIDEDSLWQFISHLSINLLTLADIKTFKEMLRLYMFPNSRDKNKVAKNQKRIDAIELFEINPIDMVSRGYLLKGHKVYMEIRQDYFASLGDLYLFCSVVFRFLSSYASLNTFVTLEVKEKITGESLKWSPILGNKKLI